MPAVTLLVALTLFALPAATLRAETIFAVYQNSLMSFDPAGPAGLGMGGGVDYDLAVSPDGRTLYHAAGEALVLRDAHTFRALSPSPVANLKNRLRWTAAVKSTIALSRDGSYLYVPKHYSSDFEEDMAIATFHTGSGSLLPKEAHLSECQAVSLFALKQPRQILVVCGGDSIVHFLSIASDGSSAGDFVLQIPPLPVKPSSGPRVGRKDSEESFVQSALTPDGSTLLLAKRDGRTAKVDVASRQVIAWPGAKPLEIVILMPSPPCLAPDGSVWYLPARAASPPNLANDRILVIDTRTLSLQTTLIPAHPFRSMAISPDGWRLYTAAQDSGQIRVVDSASGAELRVLGNERMRSVQDGPRFLLVTP